MPELVPGIHALRAAGHSGGSLRCVMAMLAPVQQPVESEHSGHGKADHHERPHPREESESCHSRGSPEHRQCRQMSAYADGATSKGGAGKEDSVAARRSSPRKRGPRLSCQLGARFAGMSGDRKSELAAHAAAFSASCPGLSRGSTS